MGIIVGLTQATTFITESAKHVANGMTNVTDQVKEERMNICSGCDFFDKVNTKCNSCGCYLNLKAAWETSKCPLDKW